MALLDPADHDRLPRRSDEQDTTTHPRLCLLGGFAFIMVTALVVHYGFNALF